ncbi:MAG: AAA family ATPase [bacterium]|nr:AAA family ATPase [Myxococcales bacterium]
MANPLCALSVEGFRSIRDQRVELHDINVLIGANGAGKSNLLSAIQLLARIAAEGLAAFVGRSGGANELLFMGARRTPIMRLGAELRLPTGGCAYRATLAHAAGGALIFTDEEVGDRVAADAAFSWTSLGSGHKESRLRLAAMDGDATAKTIRSHLQRMDRYHFDDTTTDAPIRGLVRINDDRHLRADAGNLAAWLYRVAQSDAPRFARIEGTIRQLAPYFGGFALAPARANPEFIALEWQDRGSDHVFPPTALSDGTLRSMALIAALLQPPDEMPLLAAIDEPELGLHPFAMELVASLMQAATERTQFVLSTQWTRLIECFDPADIVIADRHEGASVFHRLDPAALADWLAEYSVSELWEKNIIGGGPAA